MRGYTNSRRNLQPATVDEGIDYMNVELDIRVARAVVVPVGRGHNTLGWVADNRPEELEKLMDVTPPNTQRGIAVAAVYNANVERINTAIDRRNNQNRVRTVFGLAQRGRKGGEPLRRVDLTDDQARGYLQ